MPAPLLSHQVTIRQGAFLPHWTRDAATYAVCFRLADSPPAAVVAEWLQEREALLVRARSGGPDITLEIERRLRELVSGRVQQFLNQSRGACWLRRPDVAECVVGALRHFDGVRHRLWAWCVMPNHVHAVVQPLAAHSLSETLKSGKGFSAREANRLLGRSGKFWQVESYDHLVRDEADLTHAIRYVVENPAKASLPNWPWVWSESGTGLPTRDGGRAEIGITGRVTRATTAAGLARATRSA